MARKAADLSPLAVSKLRDPGLHFVGGVAGLALQVLPSGGRTWILRVSIGGRRRDMGLGGYPDVTLAGAKDAARNARELIREGVDPIERAKAARKALQAASARGLTFQQAAEAYIASQEVAWRNAKHRAQWTSTLTNYAYPVIGKLSVADVELAHISKVLEPIWTDKTETASRLRGRIEQILDWATARGYRTGLNPARWRGHLDKLLPRPSKISKPVHHRALAIQNMGAFYADLRTVEGVGARALTFAILTAARSGEVRGATWSEIDLERGVWTIPASRMKAGKEHRVPLSKAALEVLDALPCIAGSDLVFQAPRGGQLSDMTLSAVMRRMKASAVPHGFRSTFRDWAAEYTAYPSEVVEMALAHAVSDKVEAAYRRGDLFDKRRRLAEDWAVFCSTVAPVAGSVIPLRGSP